MDAPITLRYSLMALDESFEVDAEIDLYIGSKHIDADPDGPTCAFVELAVLKVNGKEVPHKFTQPELEHLYNGWLDEQDELTAIQRMNLNRWAA